MNKLTITTISLLLAISLFGCGLNGNESDSIVNDTTPNAMIIVTPEPTITATPEITPAPTPEATVDVEAELNQQIQDFLNKEGDFSEENIKDRIIVDNSVNRDIAKLGVMNPNPTLSGYFFGSFEKDGSIIMMVGFDGKDGNRFVTLLNCRLYIINDTGFSVSFNKLVEPRPFAESDSVLASNREDIVSGFDLVNGNFVSFEIVTEYFENLESEIPSYYYTKENLVRWVNEFESQGDFSRKLAIEVADNGVPLDIDNPDVEIVKIENIDEAKTVQVDNLPMFAGQLRYY